MKILHQTGHNKKWNIDSVFENKIGDGFIFGAFNLEMEKLISLSDSQREISSVDLQYYGKKLSDGLGKFSTYPFHPATVHMEGKTAVDGINSIIDGIKFQERNDFSKVIIPNYYESFDLEKFIKTIEAVNEYLEENKKDDFTYYMSIPFSQTFIQNETSINRLLTFLTDMKIHFDGYYIVYEAKPGYKQKVCLDFNYLSNISKVIEVLSNQGFSLILGYANWDAILFISLSNIDYVTIGTYENLRNFNNARYSEASGGGGPSDGWYFSEKLLNFIRAREIVQIRNSNSLSLISNEKNIFSDIILDSGFNWNTHKPEVHKNYLLSISRLLDEISIIKDKKERIQYTIDRIQSAQNVYKDLAERKIYLADESDNYHLGAWLSFLRSKM